MARRIGSSLSFVFQLPGLQAANSVPLLIHPKQESPWEMHGSAAAFVFVDESKPANQGRQSSEEGRMMEGGLRRHYHLSLSTKPQQVRGNR